MNGYESKQMSYVMMHDDAERIPQRDGCQRELSRREQGSGNNIVGHNERSSDYLYMQ